MTTTSFLVHIANLIKQTTNSVTITDNSISVETNVGTLKAYITEEKEYSIYYLDEENGLSTLAKGFVYGRPESRASMIANLMIENI